VLPSRHRYGRRCDSDRSIVIRLTAWRTQADQDVDPGVAIFGAQSAAAGLAVGLLVVWLVIYLRVSAPINRQLVAAVDRSGAAVDARGLQRDWDAVITIRAVLQGSALAALCAALLM
jgi:hypothetical protein